MLPKTVCCFERVHRPNVGHCMLVLIFCSNDFEVFEAIFEPHFEIMHSNQDLQVLNA